MGKKYFQQMVLKHFYTHMQKYNLDLNLTLHTKIKSRWIIDPNVKHKAIKLLEKKNIEETLHDLGLGKEFLDMIPKA